MRTLDDETHAVVFLNSNLNLFQSSLIHIDKESLHENPYNI